MKPSIILFSLLICAVSVRAQSNVETKKDTLYYLVDTAKTLKSDRIFSIDTHPRFVFYSVACPCIPSNSGFMFYYSSIKGLPDTTLKENVDIKKSQIKKMQFLPLYKLIEIVCKEQGHTNINHVIYFIQHMPNGKYISRKVTLTPPFSPEK